MNLLSLDQETFIELFEVSDYRLANPAETRRFCQYAGVSFYGQPYEAVPIETRGFDLTTSGPSPRPSIVISNLGASVSSFLAALKGPGYRLEGLLFTRRLTQPQYLDGGARANAAIREQPIAQYRLEQISSINKVAVEFVLETGFGLDGATLPGRPESRICQWRYRGPECGWTGGGFTTANQPTINPLLDRCNGYLSGCQVRYGATAQLPYGGFPGLGEQRI